MVDEEKKMNNDSQDSLDLDVSDEIVVRDKDGSFKVLIGGQLKKLDGEEVKPIDKAQIKPAPPREELFTEEGLVSKEPVADRLAPPTPAPWQKAKGAAFYFDAEDEEEVGKIAVEKELPGIQDISYYVKDIIDKSNLDITDKEQLKRVKNIIQSYLKHVRDKVGTQEILIRPLEEGGAGLESARTENLLALAARALQKIESGQEASGPTDSVKEGISDSVKPVSELDRLIKQSDDIYDFTDQKSVQETEAGEYKDILAEEIAAQKPEFTQAPEFKEVESPPQAVKTEVSLPKISRSAITDSGRPKMQDVVAAAKLRGPVDELKYMSLAELRRIGTNSLDNIANIKNKIQALEEESFSKKVEGIKAWRQSPLYNLYVQIGRDSMEKGKSVSEIINAKQQAGEETLTLSEFEKITDLNKELRY